MQRFLSFNSIFLPLGSLTRAAGYATAVAQQRTQSDFPKTFSAANASSGKVFPPHLQETLHKASKQHGYESKFWVTAEGMKRFGVALKDPNAKGIEAAYKDSKNIWYNADQTTRPSIVTFSQPIFFSGKAVPFTMHTALRKAKCEKRYLSDIWIHATSIPRLPHLGGVKPGEEPVLVPDGTKVYNIEQMMNPKGKRMSSAITGRTYPFTAISRVRRSFLFE